ncbi:hypothetical protein BGZ76_007848 [Entomortierella beljakovae]|nr:hypothetical protein BGZ76_007848 [Entomortierella beljakovae]
MLASVFGVFKQPSISVRIPNDDSSFNPKEYPNVVFKATGKMSGKITLVHGGKETDDTGLGLISTRIWVVQEQDKDEIHIKPTFDNKTHTFRLEAPEGFNVNNIYHETLIQYPRTAASVDSLSVAAPNTTFSGESLFSLLFGSISSALTNGSISLSTIRADTIRLHTTNSNISGDYDAGHIELQTTNGSISGALNVRDALNGNQSVVSTMSTNGTLDLRVTATETTRGLWMENQTKNGKVIVGALLGKADRASIIKASTSNGKIDFNLDASQSGQPLEVHNTTSNGPVVSSTMLPACQAFKGAAVSSNGPVNVNLTEEFQGRFELDTSNGPSSVEGTNLTFEQNKKYSKHGYRVQNGPSEFKITTSNGPAALRFYPAGSNPQ